MQMEAYNGAGVSGKAFLVGYVGNTFERSSESEHGCVTPALRKQRQEDLGFQASLVRQCLKNRQTSKQTPSTVPQIIRQVGWGRRQGKVFPEKVTIQTLQLSIERTVAEDAEKRSP